MRVCVEKIPKIEVHIFVDFVFGLFHVFIVANNEQILVHSKRMKSVSIHSGIKAKLMLRVCFRTKIFSLLTQNYTSPSAITDLHALKFTLALTHWGSQSSLVVSWQRGFNILAITTYKVFKPRSCNLTNSQLPSFLIDVQLSTPDTPKILIVAGLCSSLYRLSSASTENTSF
jgi:hypothetical protein